MRPQLRLARNTVLLWCSLVGVCCAAACSAGGNTPGPSATGPRPQYVAMVDSVVAHHGTPWIEVDLLKAWVTSPGRYASVLNTVTQLASRPGVGGVKIADELGYDDGTNQATVLAFLKATTATLHSRLPGRKVLVDFIVPELGCLSWQPGASPQRAACAAQEVAKNPATSLAAMDSYVANGGLDVIDLSAGLRSDAEYAAWGTTRDDAMTAAWNEATRRWGGTVKLQARKAMAHDGPYDGTALTAAADVKTFVDIPLAHGATAVDVWTWSQPYKGGTYTLTDPGLEDNPLVDALRARRERGVQLWTHMTPSSLQVGLDADVQAALTTFSTVFVTSGTG